jgi:hypothetical protein
MLCSRPYSSTEPTTALDARSACKAISLARRTRERTVLPGGKQAIPSGRVASVWRSPSSLLCAWTSVSDGFVRFVLSARDAADLGCAKGGRLLRESPLRPPSALVPATLCQFFHTW